jgi:hypothetical protein
MSQESRPEFQPLGEEAGRIVRAHNRPRHQDRSREFGGLRHASEGIGFGAVNDCVQQSLAPVKIELGFDLKPHGFAGGRVREAQRMRVKTHALKLSAAVQ